MFQKLRFLVIPFCALILTACDAPPEFSESLGEPIESYDERLKGRWQLVVGEEGDGVLVSAHIWSSESSPLLNINYSHEYESGIYAWALEAHATKIDGETFFNVKRLRSYPQFDYTAPEKEPGYIIMRPVLIDDDTLVVCGLFWNAEEELESALENLGVSAHRSEKVPPDRRGISGSVGAFTHTYVELNREKLISFVRRQDIHQAFIATLFLRRVGSGAASLIFEEEFQKKLGFRLEESLKGKCQFR